jgi:hypothetical protein
VGNAFGHTKVQQIRKFVSICRPVGGFTRRMVVVVEALNEVLHNASLVRDETRSPVGILGIVVATC